MIVFLTFLLLIGFSLVMDAYDGGVESSICMKVLDHCVVGLYCVEFGHSDCVHTLTCSIGRGGGGGLDSLWLIIAIVEYCD